MKDDTTQNLEREFLFIRDTRNISFDGKTTVMVYLSIVIFFYTCEKDSVDSSKVSLIIIVIVIEQK